MKTNITIIGKSQDVTLGNSVKKPEDIIVEDSILI